MEAFKFLSEKHVENLRAGNFRLGRLRYFQLLELAFGDTSIGDANEGKQVTRVDVPASGAERATMLERLKDCGAMDLGGVTDAIVQGCRVVSQADGFVLCCSVGDLAALTAELTTGSNGVQPYDACVRICDVDALASEFVNTAQLDDGRALGEAFECLGKGVVRYDAAEADMRDGPAAPADPFRKRVRYRAQSEYRFFFKPRKAIERDFLFIHCPGAARLLERIPIQPRARDQVALPGDRPPEFWQARLWKILDLRDGVYAREQGLMFALAQRRSSHEWIARGQATSATFDKRFLQRLIRSYFELRDLYRNPVADENIVDGLGTAILRWDLRKTVPRP
jgi:hypothetical protein